MLPTSNLIFVILFILQYFLYHTRVAIHQAVVRNVVTNHSVGGYPHIISYRYLASYHGTCKYLDVVANGGLSVLAPPNGYTLVHIEIAAYALCHYQCAEAMLHMQSAANIGSVKIACTLARHCYVKKMSQYERQSVIEHAAVFTFWQLRHKMAQFTPLKTP